MKHTTPLLGTSVLLALGAVAGAQAPTVVVQEGDAVAGVGNVTTISNIWAASTGTVLVEVDTDNPNTDIDSALLNGGVAVLQEGQALPAPAGAMLGSFDTVNANIFGSAGWNFFLDGTASTSDDSGVYFNTVLLIQESDVSASPAFTAPTPYIGFFECKINDSNDVLVMASVDDPAIASNVDRALVLLTNVPAAPVENVLAKEGDLLPGQVDVVADFETGPHNFDLNDHGDVIVIADLEGDTAVDHVVYLNSTILAQEGSPSPVAGRNWATLSSAEVSIDNNGRWAISGSLDGDTTTNLLIEVSGAKFRQEGDTLPAIGGFQFTTFGSGPVDVADNGDVLWYGDWDDANLDVDTGLFINDELIVQEGVTTIGGVVVDTLRGVQDGYNLSDNGQYVVFEAILADGTDGAFLIDRGGFEPLPGCFGNQATLAHVDGGAGIGDTFTLRMDQAQATGSFAFLAVSNSAIAGFPPCGINLPFGELFVSVTPPNPILVFVGATTWAPGFPVDLVLNLPNDPTLVGQDFFNQGVFFLPGGPETFRLTSALELEVGP